jgi:hypothetical protein
MARLRDPAFRAELLAYAIRKRARERAIRRYVAAGARPLAFRGPTSRFIYVIHQDTHPASLGQWRITTIDCTDGQPWGHTVPGAFDACLREAAQDGADITQTIPIR